MKLPNSVYEVLKWISLIALDAFGYAYDQLANVWGLPFGPQVQDTCQIIALLIGVLIGVSTYKYNKDNVTDE